LITLAMNMPHLRTLDLNLLRVFLALLDEGSVTRAGARLGVTQSAVSHALNRLRYGLEDELFVRGPSGMQPTARAAEIAPRLRQGLAHLQAALAPASFDPADTDRHFVIAAGAYSASVLLPEVIARVQAEAPRASIQVRGAFKGVVEELDAGRSDLVIGAFGRTPDRFDCEVLFRDRLVWVLRADHPAAAQPLTIESLAALPHLVVAAADAADMIQGSVLEHGVERRVAMDDNVLSDELAARGLDRVVALTLPDMHSALAIVARSDMATAAPRGLAQVFGEALGLKTMEPPYPSPPRDIVALWRKDHDGPALQWLRGLLREAGAAFMERLDDQ
jgi:DNA-binding transcriptional LysR family regulator